MNMMILPQKSVNGNMQQLLLHIEVHHSAKNGKISCPSYIDSMTTTFSYFQSPFVDETEQVVEPWRPAFPDDDQQEKYGCVYADETEIEEKQVSYDPPDVLTVVSYENQTNQKQQTKKKGTGREEEEGNGILDGLSFSDDVDIDLADLQNIDININQPVTAQKGQKESSFDSLIQEIHPASYFQGGRVLSTKKYQGNQFDEQWMRRLDKTIAARAFVYRGYGINYLKQQLRSGNYDKYALDQSKYKSISGSMARQSFRRLQSFLMRDCQRKLHSLSGHQMKLLQTLLLNCRTSLTRSTSLSFLQIVKITYTLQNTSITEREGVVLYETIYRALQKKIGVLRGHSVPSERSSEHFRRKDLMQARNKVAECESVSTGVQREIIREYLNQNSISKVRDALRVKRILGDASTVQTIRNVLRRVLRRTIRRVEEFLNQTMKQYKQRRNMRDEQIKWITQASQCLQARRQLCRIYLSDREDRKVFESVYRQMRESLYKKDSFHGVFLQNSRAQF